MENKSKEALIAKGPAKLAGLEHRFDAFTNGTPLYGKKKGHLPMMGWNSWNAFGSGNTEALTKQMADRFLELGLDQLGYQYLVLDDGCYKQERVEGLLSNEEVKFPSGFRALADYIHGKGLKFGMYNDIGTNLCAGAAVGTCGHEEEDTQCYVDWDVDFLKVDNCYYLWDNATFSDASNAKYVFAPKIMRVRLTPIEDKATVLEYSWEDMTITGTRGKVDKGIFFIGTYDGTGPDASPVGEQSSEIQLALPQGLSGEYGLEIEYATGQEEGIGEWLQVAVDTCFLEDGKSADTAYFYDGFLPETSHYVTKENDQEEPQKELVLVAAWSAPIKIVLRGGKSILRLMNHRRQENTLHSYATFVAGLNKAKPDHDIILSICEWGKTQPQNWGYKAGDSWRILNDITFQVGADGDPGVGHWVSDYTTSVTTQYNKAVIMDEFAGLEKGWNDPDMMMIGMNGLTDTMCQTHMTMWCMMNSPLMLGLDLRRVEKGDAWHQIITNEKAIALNQDSLGIQAKRVCVYQEKPVEMGMTQVGSTGDSSSLRKTEGVDQEYIRDIHRVDILAKPLADGSVAVSFINVSEEAKDENYCISVREIVEAIGDKMVEKEQFMHATTYQVLDIWTGEETNSVDGSFTVNHLEACGNVTLRIKGL